MKLSNEQGGTMKAKTQRVPIDLSFSQMERGELDRDWLGQGDFTLLTDGIRVWLSEQPSGESPKQKIELPREVFDRLARWYVTGEIRRVSKRMTR